jgi:hypothetical protein
MANLLSNSQIASYVDAFNSIHDTFGRNIIIIKESKRVLVQEIDSNYNYFYGRAQQNSVKEEFIPVSGVFKMRIQWQDPTKELFGGETNEVRPKIHDNTCRLKMKKDAYDFINGYKSFVIDGRSCEWIGFSKPHGIVGVDFYTIFVKETN